MKIDGKYINVIKSLIKTGIGNAKTNFTNLVYIILDAKKLTEKILVPNILFWDPLRKSKSLFCPHCQQDGFKSYLQNSEHWDVGQSKSHFPRALWDDGWYCAPVGKIYHCKNNHSINSYHAGIIDQIPIDKVPFMLTFKTGITKTLFHKITRFLEVGVSFNGMEGLLSSNFVDECHRRNMMLQNELLLTEQIKEIISSFSLSDHLLRQCFVVHFEAYKKTYQQELDKIPFKSLSFDHTFKVATNIGYWKDNKWIKVYDSLFILMNEKGYIKAYQYTKGTALENVINKNLTAGRT